MQKFLKTTSITVTTMFFGVSTIAQTPTSSLPGLFACRPIEDNLERVKCYDKVADELQAADLKGEIVTITKQQVEEMEEQSFGFNLPSIPKLSSLFGTSKSENITASNSGQDKKNKDTAKNLAIPIKSVQVFNHNLTRFYLENGQVWEQKSGRALRLRIREGRPAIAHIYRGALSGYRLRVNGKGEQITVRRIQ